MKGNSRGPGTQRGVAGPILLLSSAILLVGIFVAFQFVDPAPPRNIVLATGADGGAYQQFGVRYAELLADVGIEVTLRETAGSVENLELLAEDSGVDLAFVQSGLAGLTGGDDVIALGSLYLEPLWLFVRDDFDVEGIADLSGARVSSGAVGSGTRTIVLNLLNAHDVSVEHVDATVAPGSDLKKMLSEGELDAVFVVGDPESEVVSGFIRRAGARPVSLDRVDAYVRRYSYTTRVVLPAGVVDLKADLPAEDIHAVAVTAMLVGRSDLHPALVDVLLVAAADIHGQHSLLAESGEFPTSRYVDFPLSEEAERHFKYGPPFLMRYLPFWAATFVDRMWVMLLPLLGLAIPLVKLFPPAYKWRVRRRLLRLYTELEQLDPNVNPMEGVGESRQRLEKLDELDQQSVITSVPRDYKDNIYKLRRDIDLVRRRLRVEAAEAE
ncbi:MAG: TAXI family TRAP transporter solute-binding subunit [Gammaproteobacteria bacterium]|nr:TAXI family TRAP transporter solute-binding subunit [Gammaproteobacteria bacterium]